MLKILKTLSILPQGLRYKLLIGFVLMSIIPLLVLVYLVTNFIFGGETFSIQQISIVVLLSVIIAWLGLVLAKGLIDPVIDMSIQARIIANGDFERKIRISTEDEIGDLGMSINLLTKRIKDNVQELKEYGEKTREINSEIQKKMLALSNLLQIGDLITASVDLDKILDVVTVKLSQLYEGGFSAIYLPKKKADEFVIHTNNNLIAPELINAVITPGEGVIGRIIQKGKIAVIDNSTQRTTAEHEFKTKHRFNNIVIIPLFAGKEARGVILLGNGIGNFIYTNEDIDIIKVFARQLSIALENDMLLKKTEALAIKDDLTGMFNRNFILPRLKEEIKRAILYQRPCSFLVIDIDDFKEYRDKRGQLAAENALKKISQALKNIIGPIDKAGRLGDDEFALLLPEKNKKAAFDTAEKVRDAVAQLKFSDNDQDRLTVSIGASENPLDGSTEEELLKKAQKNVKEAKLNGRNKIVI